MKPVSEMPGSLAIVKVDDRHYQLNDTSVPSIGLCLGVFPTLGAAKSFAEKLVKIRSLRPAAAARRPEEAQPVTAAHSIPRRPPPQPTQPSSNSIN